MPSPLGPPSLPSMDPTSTLEEPEVARLHFRGFCYQEVAGPQEAVARLRELCRQWLRPEVRSKEQMLELLVLEQFLGALPPEIRAWVHRQQPGSPEEAAALVEGLQHDPGQLLGWITAHVLKQEVLPAARKTKESLGSLHPSGTVDCPRAAPEELPQDTQVDGSAHLCCIVKEELDADGKEMASSSPPVSAHSLEEHLGHQKPDSSSFNLSKIQEEWGLLDPSQKELYWDVMLEKYGTVVSQAGFQAPEPEAHAKPEPRVQCLGTEGPRGLRSGEERESRPDVLPTLGNTPEDPLPAPRGDRLAPGGPRRKPYVCEQCGCSFDWKSVFVIHHRTHAGGPRVEQPLQGLRDPAMPRHPRGYACSECGRSFSWKSQLVIHRKSHAGQRRHSCGDCGRGFDWKSQLVVHRRSHRPMSGQGSSPEPLRPGPPPPGLIGRLEASEGT